jgi:hypothetical protein
MLLEDKTTTYAGIKTMGQILGISRYITFKLKRHA